LLCAFGLVAVGSLAVPSARAMGGERAAKDKWFVVAQVAGMDGGLTYEALESSKVAARRNELMAEYRKAFLEWRKSKSGPRPHMPSVVTLKQVRGREEATKHIAELEARHSVVMIRDMEGKAAYEAVQSIALPKRKAQLDAEYTKALAKYEAEKKAAGPGKAVSLKRPRKPSMIVVQRDLKDQPTADAVVARLMGKKG